MEARSLCFFIILFCIVSYLHILLGKHKEDSRIEPEAWGHEESLQNSHQNQNNVENCHSADTVALIYYKRLIAYFFNNDSFKYDEVTGEFNRVIILTALPGQLEQLKSFNDPRDLDSVLSQILTKAREPKDDHYYYYGGLGNGSMDILALIWDIFKVVAQLLKASEGQILLGAAILALCVWYCHRKYNIGIISLIIGAVICFGYFHTYLECNRKLEAERLMEMLARHEPRWYTPILKIFTSSDQKAKEAKEYIKQLSQWNLSFCRPDHVFLVYANDLFLKPLGKCTEKIRDNLGFIFNYLATVLLLGLIGYIYYILISKYILSPRAWTAHISPHRTYHNALPLSSDTAHHEDRVSGENTSNKITISTTAATASLTQSPETTSGVQEILLPLENCSKADTATESSKSETAAEKSKHNLPHKQVDKTDNNDEAFPRQSGLRSRNDPDSYLAKDCHSRTIPQKLWGSCMRLQQQQDEVENLFDVSDDCDKSTTVELEDIADDKMFIAIIKTLIFIIYIIYLFIIP